MLKYSVLFVRMFPALWAGRSSCRPGRSSCRPRYRNKFLAVVTTAFLTVRVDVCLM
jgi:hypothetical protein